MVSEVFDNIHCIIHVGVCVLHLSLIIANNIYQCVQQFIIKTYSWLWTLVVVVVVVVCVCVHVCINLYICVVHTFILKKGTPDALGPRKVVPIMIIFLYVRMWFIESLICMHRQLVETFQIQQVYKVSCYSKHRVQCWMFRSCTHRVKYL